ncbi:uncharacterized protein [Eucyclogobius newberryi]|uniref:uncharacterized protein isoform X2 n=1 Tax=Eucyclogobius newberryi TaxID=166745 RepID=UPI003B5AAE7C
MEGNVLSLASSSSLSLSAAGVQLDGAKMSEELWSQRASPAADRLLSAEEQVTLITDSMTVTSTDQEKLLLLNKNTDLRRINKDLMKVNEEWDQVYRSATLSLQQRVEALELENSAIKTLNNKLLLKGDHQQSIKGYEQALMLECKKNQELQEYLRHVERRLPPSEQTGSSKQGNFMILSSSTSGNPPEGPKRSPISPHSFIPAAPSPRAELGGLGHCSSAQGDPQQEVQDLKEQLQAMHCQTQIYEAEFQMENKSHKHTLQENRRLRKKREEMRQQVALLQEQLKVYEDDFRRERSDKQMLQRLLKKTQPSLTHPVLIHRCNNEKRPVEGDKRTHHEDQPHQKQHHVFCPKHQARPQN